MKIFGLSLLLVLFPSLSFAFYWTKSGAAVTQNIESQNNDIQDVTDNELEAIYAAHSALSAYETKPDCFKRAASTVRVRCDRLELDEDERINAALRLTLCELATARHHSPPLECAKFDSKYDYGLDTTLGKSQRECVEALSRSAQFWSSYSGYLREVPQLCYAYRRWHDIDTAKEIYMKVSKEKLVLLDKLQGRENRLDLQLRQWEGYTSGLEGLLGRAELAHRGLEKGIAASLSAFDEHFSMLIAELYSSAQELRVNNIESHKIMQTQVETGLDGIVQQHARALSFLSTTLSSSLNASFAEVLVVWHQQSELSVELISDVVKTWKFVMAEYASLQEMARAISRLSADSFTSLQLSVEQGVILQTLNMNASLSLNRLTSDIARLTETSQNSLERINDTSTSVILGIQSNLKGTHIEWADWLGYALGTISRGCYLNPTSIRLLTASLALTFYLLKVVLSGFASFVIAIISLRRYISGRNMLLRAQSPPSDSASSPAFSYDYGLSICPQPQSLCRSRPDPRLQKHTYQPRTRVYRVPVRGL